MVINTARALGGTLSLLVGLVLLTAAAAFARPASGPVPPDISQLHTDGEKLSRLNLVRAVAANVVCPQPEGCPATAGRLVQLPDASIEVHIMYRMHVRTGCMYVNVGAQTACALVAQPWHSVPQCFMVCLNHSCCAQWDVTGAILCSSGSSGYAACSPTFVNSLLFLLEGVVW